MRRLFCFLGVLAVVGGSVLARAEDPEPGARERIGAGPPLLIDDTGTPGPAHWEINLALTAQKFPNDGKLQLNTPLIDINYGVGERIQLKYEVPLTIQRTDGGTDVGEGISLIGVKWRFLDDKHTGVAVSIYPQVELKPFSSRFAHKIGAEGPNILLPLQISKAFDNSLTLGLQVGYQINTHSHFDDLTYGISAGYRAFEQVALLAELFADSRSDLGEHELLVNVGSRVRLSKHIKLLVSAGHSVFDSSHIGPRWIGYLGVQYTY